MNLIQNLFIVECYYTMFCLWKHNLCMESSYNNVTNKFSWEIEWKFIFFDFTCNRVPTHYWWISLYVMYTIISTKCGVYLKDSIETFPTSYNMDIDILWSSSFNNSFLCLLCISCKSIKHVLTLNRIFESLSRLSKAIIRFYEWIEIWMSDLVLDIAATRTSLHDY